jgi:CBS-domain-containing membrane protein
VLIRGWQFARSDEADTWTVYVTRRKGRTSHRKEGGSLIGIVIAILVSAVVFWLCSAIGLPYIVAVVAAILVLVAGIPTGGYGFGGRFSTRRY